MAQEPQFRETQRIWQPWIWVLPWLISVLSLLFPALVFNSVSLVFASVVSVLILLVFLLFFYSIQLITEVRADGIYIRFAPVHRSFRRIPFDQIKQVERTEFGLLTYGGIGIRWTPDTVAYITSRGSGIKIDRENAKSVVVGSQKPSPLAETIDEFH
jgi:hypothetical protein